MQTERADLPSWQDLLPIGIEKAGPFLGEGDADLRGLGIPRPVYPQIHRCRRDMPGQGFQGYLETVALAAAIQLQTFL